LGHPPALHEAVLLSTVHRDYSYGREVTAARVQELVAKWDSASVGVLLLSVRSDGTYVCLDGWHRASAARQVGVVTLPARVYRGLTPQQEAALYLAFDERRIETPWEKFRARLLAGDPLAVSLNRATQSVGLSIAMSKSGHDGEVRAVVAAQRVYKVRGEAVYLDTLRLLLEAYHHLQASREGRDIFASWALQGLSDFLVRYPDAQRRRVVDLLHSQGIKGMHSLSRQVQVAAPGLDIGTCWGIALRDLYNKRLRGGARLGEWKSKVFGDGKAGESGHPKGDG